jgi:hypothetical protein
MINRRRIRILLYGMAKAFDLGNSLRSFHPAKKPPKITFKFYRDDYKALESDWITVGNDLRSAMNHVSEKNVQAFQTK